MHLRKIGWFLNAIALDSEISTCRPYYVVVASTEKPRCQHGPDCSDESRLRSWICCYSQRYGQRYVDLKSTRRVVSLPTSKQIFCQSVKTYAIDYQGNGDSRRKVSEDLSEQWNSIDMHHMIMKPWNPFLQWSFNQRKIRKPFLFVQMRNFRPQVFSRSLPSRSDFDMLATLSIWIRDLDPTYSKVFVVACTVWMGAENKGATRLSLNISRTLLSSSSSQSSIGIATTGF